jgi:hypothetical protein
VTASENLHALNLRMMTQESAGNVEYFDALLAPVFAMRRGDLVTMVDRPTFLAGVAEGAPRATEDFEILLETASLAVVRSTVAQVKDGQLGRFTNIRVFVRQSSIDEWQLLSWINEPAGAST